MKKSMIKLLLMVVMVIFISAYYVSNSGYYEYTVHENVVLTNEKIKEFEQDVKENKEIDLVEYLDNDSGNYSNKFTNLIYSFSDSGNKSARKLMKRIFKKISEAVEE